MKTVRIRSFSGSPLRENCPNTELFLVRVFLYLDWIQENTDQKQFRNWTLLTQFVFSRIRTEYGDLQIYLVNHYHQFYLGNILHINKSFKTDLCKDSVFSPYTGKKGPEKTPNPDSFYAVVVIAISEQITVKKQLKFSKFSYN